MRLNIAVIVLANFLSLSCKRRQSLAVDPGSPGFQSANSQDDLNSMRHERDELIAKLKDQQVEEAGRIAELTLERDKYFEDKKALDDEVARFNKELNSNKELSAVQRQEMQGKLDAANKSLADLAAKFKKNEEELTAALDKIKSLSDEIKSLNDRIKELNAKIENLEKDLADEKARNASSGGVSDSNTPTTTTTTTTDPSTSTSTPTTTQTPAPAGKLSAQSWQFLLKNADATESCFEFASTTANAALLATSCVTPAPVRQLFKTEDFSNGFLLIDQRTQMCLSLDGAAADPATARVFLATCNRAGEQNEIFKFIEVDIDTGEFKIRNVKTLNCLQISANKVVQSACGTASLLRTKP